MPHNVYTGNVSVDLVRQVQTQHHWHELRIGQYLFGGYHACFQNLLVVVDIVQKHIDCFDALHQAFFQLRPFFAVDDAWYQVRGNQSLGTAFIAIE